MKKMSKGLALVMALVMVVLTGCSYKDTYRYQYADKWESPFELAYEDGTPIELQDDKELDKLLEECKDMINETDMKELYPYFNWELLEKAEICHSKGVKLKSGEARTEGMDAKYFVKLNKVLVFPVCSEYEEDYLKTLILHELMHTLTYSEEAVKLQIWEGVADFFAGQISNLNALPFKLQYQYEVLYLTQLFTVFGEVETQKMIFDGELANKLDELTKEGMSEKFNSALAILSSFYEIYGNLSDTETAEELVKVIQDVMCHMTANYCEELEEEERAAILESFKGMLIIDDSYFEKLLE